MWAEVAEILQALSKITSSRLEEDCHMLRWWPRNFLKMLTLQTFTQHLWCNLPYCMMKQVTCIHCPQCQWLVCTKEQRSICLSIPCATQTPNILGTIYLQSLYQAHPTQPFLVLRVLEALNLPVTAIRDGKDQINCSCFWGQNVNGPVMLWRLRLLYFE